MTAMASVLTLRSWEANEQAALLLFVSKGCLRMHCAGGCACVFTSMQQVSCICICDLLTLNKAWLHIKSCLQMSNEPTDDCRVVVRKAV